MRAVARFALRSCMRLSGRSFPYRLGRLLMNEARFDAPNDPASNGEHMVQATVLRYAPAGRKIVVLDIGANVGDWTIAMLQHSAKNQDVQVHAFEPCRGTYNILVNRLGTRRGVGLVTTVCKACSSSPGTATLHVAGVGAGTNSLTCTDQMGDLEDVPVTSVDEYCREAQVDHVTLMKIDAEGHDLEVIRGAARMLRQHAIDVVQFEYNQRWIYGHSFLRDAFNFVAPLGYAIGKVTPHGIEFYPEWHWELETFREGNYLACRQEWVQRFQKVLPAWNRSL
jgi:FkbM family methyltransferase